MRYRTYTCRLSTGSLPAALPPPKRDGETNLGEGFVLRCFQHLSTPSIATLRWGWRPNRYTRGWSTQVLSY
ncbi:MAG: hypothetical protein B1H03_04725 [Planctomycetales bacterium 4484_113]|nr:MAG: hypothetical protein B1H03_04725 [Planctomycetales bacterium 4484_113]